MVCFICFLETLEVSQWKAFRSPFSKIVLETYLWCFFTESVFRSSPQKYLVMNLGRIGIRRLYQTRSYLSSLKALRNSLMASASPFANSGSFFPPKRTSKTAETIKISVKPMLLSIFKIYHANAIVIASPDYVSRTWRSRFSFNNSPSPLLI